MLRLSCDDGCSSDVRVARLCKKYGIGATFYLPCEWHSLAYDNGYQPLTYRQARTIADDFEIGSHTITHRHLTKISQGEAEYEIEYSKLMLEELFGSKVNDFAPPRGYTTDLLTEFTMRFYEKQRLTKGPGLVHIHPNSGANDNEHWVDRYYNLVESGVSEIELWMHSFDLDRFGLWDQLEEVLGENKHP